MANSLRIASFVSFDVEIFELSVSKSNMVEQHLSFELFKTSSENIFPSYTSKNTFVGEHCLKTAVLIQLKML